MKLVLSAYSKLNLSLRVTGTRSDGFHTLDSLVQTIDLSDVLTIEPAARGVEVHCAQRIRGENIVCVAAQRTLEALRTRNGVRIHLCKQVPIGAGLGGGSSDAAAAIWGTNTLYGAPLNAADMLAIARTIGADVPLFLSGGRMKMQGVGEILNPEPQPEECYALLVPPIHCETAKVYAAFDVLAAAGRNDTVTHGPGSNDLKPAALEIYPDLARYAASIDACGGAYGGMTGSGSGFFASFPDREGADKAVLALQQEHPGARVYTCCATPRGFEELERTP